MLPAQLDREYIEEHRRRSAPWTTEHYERVRNAAIAMVRTHISWDRPDGSIRPSVDGASYWELLSALDRVGMHSATEEE